MKIHTTPFLPVHSPPKGNQRPLAPSTFVSLILFCFVSCEWRFEQFVTCTCINGVMVTTQLLSLNVGMPDRAHNVCAIKEKAQRQREIGETPIYLENFLV